jgi:hypothetical protein
MARGWEHSYPRFRKYLVLLNVICDIGANTIIYDYRDGRTIGLNFETLSKLHTLLLDGYNDFVSNAPADWKKDGFLLNNKPIIITSRYGQNACIALEDNEDQEANDWNLERDYSKIAYLTFALATSIESVFTFIRHHFLPSILHFLRCSQIHEWDPIPNRTIRRNHGHLLFDDADELCRRRVNLDDHPLLDNNGQEVPLFDPKGNKISRRIPLIDHDEPQCGVLMDLGNIHALFNSESQLNAAAEDSDELIGEASEFVQVDAYPLGFLRTAGNFQASSVPQCFFPILARINQSVRQDPNHPPSNLEDSDDDHMSVDQDEDSMHVGGAQVVKPVASQFYNYIAHRTATRAGRHYSQQGTVTAALAGAFAGTNKDKKRATELQAYCDLSLPSDRFHQNISIEDCPTSCRAELVYSVDVRALKRRSGRYVFIKYLSSPFTHINFIAQSTIILSFLWPNLGMKMIFSTSSRSFLSL